jgi:hypothetical protein
LLIKALDGGEWSVFRSGHFTPGRNGRWIGDQFGTRVDLDAMEENNVCSWRVSNPSSLAINPAI